MSERERKGREERARESLAVCWEAKGKAQEVVANWAERPAIASAKFLIGPITIMLKKTGPVLLLHIHFPLQMNAETCLAHPRLTNTPRAACPSVPGQGHAAGSTTVDAMASWVGKTGKQCCRPAQSNVCILTWLSLHGSGIMERPRLLFPPNLPSRRPEHQPICPSHLSPLHLILDTDKKRPALVCAKSVTLTDTQELRHPSPVYSFARVMHRIPCIALEARVAEIRTICRCLPIICVWGTRDSPIWQNSPVPLVPRVHRDVSTYSYLRYGVEATGSAGPHRFQGSQLSPALPLRTGHVLRDRCSVVLSWGNILMYMPFHVAALVPVDRGEPKPLPWRSMVWTESVAAYLTRRPWPPLAHAGCVWSASSDPRRPAQVLASRLPSSRFTSQAPIVSRLDWGEYCRPRLQHPSSHAPVRIKETVLHLHVDPA
jgi:hypothetical protein